MSADETHRARVEVKDDRLEGSMRGIERSILEHGAREVRGDGCSSMQVAVMCPLSGHRVHAGVWASLCTLARGYRWRGGCEH